VAVSPFQVSPSGVVIAGFGIQETGINARSQPPEIHCDFEQASQPAEIDQLVRAPLLMAPERLPSESKPEIPARQLALHGLLRARRRQRGQMIRRIARMGFTAIGPGQGGFPEGHPAAAGLALTTFALDDDGIEEAGCQPGEPTLGAKGAAEGREGGTQVVRSAPAHAESDAGRTTDSGAHREPAGMANLEHSVAAVQELYLFFTFSLPKSRVAMVNPPGQPCQS
jgi:hypothetical protein